MIIANIIGGLGNQMFQYATARALSKKLDQPLLLDTSDFDGYQLHNGFELDQIFDIAPKLASVSDLRNLLGWQASPIIRKAISKKKFLFLRKRELIVEPYFQFWDELENIPQDAYLLGYWQSEKYFKLIETTIRSDFSFKQKMSSKNQEIADEILKSNAVSIHIRRGDYLLNPAANKVHGLCSLEYYNKAIQYIVERVKNPSFFVFSDDIDWAKTNLNISYPSVYVSHNQGAESFNDMRLMSLCNHNIIANSSFSWWGAWLNKNPKKFVVAPKRWFNANLDVSDLLPSEWSRI